MSCCANRTTSYKEVYQILGIHFSGSTLALVFVCVNSHSKQVQVARKDKTLQGMSEVLFCEISSIDHITSRQIQLAEESNVLFTLGHWVKHLAYSLQGCKIRLICVTSAKSPLASRSLHPQQQFCEGPE